MKWWIIIVIFLSSLTGINISEGLSAPSYGADINLSCGNQTGASFDFRGCEFQGENFRTIKLNHSNFSGVDLSKSSLVQGHFWYADFTDANLSYSNLNRADFQHAVMQRVNLSHVTGHEATIAKADLRGADLSFSDFTHSTFGMSNLAGANLEGGNFKDVKFLLTNFDSANLSGANLAGAMLVDASFVNSNLDGVNFKGANLDGADFSRAKNLDPLILNSPGIIYTDFPPVPSPYFQLKNSPGKINIECNSGLELIFKSTTNSPACVKPKTAQKLFERGWTALGNAPKVTSIESDFKEKTSSQEGIPAIPKKETSGLDHLGVWGIGENLRMGDYFSYKLCQVKYKDCTEFEIEFWIKENSKDIFIAKTVVYEGNKIVNGVTEFKGNDFSLSSKSDKLQPYIEAFKNSVLALNRFATTSDEGGAVGPKAFSEKSWGQFGKISGESIVPTTIQKVSVPAGNYESVLITFSPGNKTNKVWVVDELPFPVKADVWSEVSVTVQEYKFELVNFENNMKDPYGVISTFLPFDEN